MKVIFSSVTSLYFFACCLHPKTPKFTELLCHYTIQYLNDAIQKFTGFFSSHQHLTSKTFCSKFLKTRLLVDSQLNYIFWQNSLLLAFGSFFSAENKRKHLFSKGYSELESNQTPAVHGGIHITSNISSRPCHAACFKPNLSLSLMPAFLTGYSHASAERERAQTGNRK